MSLRKVSENYVPGQEVRSKHYFEQSERAQPKKSRREEEENEQYKDPEAEYQGELEWGNDGD